ncbi:MAG TPA: response regulator [Ktedonobacterales bacterium]|nr:response regulator [Ktedonobacterales bacterium]
MPSALVVDEDVGIRKLLTFVLREYDYSVQAAAHGGYALDILRRSGEGMIVTLGLVMPIVNGAAVLEAVAEDETLAARHVFIMVTGCTPGAESGRVAALRNYLGVPLLPKPFTLEQIDEAITEAARRMYDRQGWYTAGGVFFAAKSAGES